MNCDVVIIGAGIAGLSCGISLAKYGVRSVILEKSRDCTSKLCGGILTKKALSVFRNLVPEFDDKAQLQRVQDISICFEKSKYKLKYMKDTVYVLDRSTLATVLLNEYSKYGDVLYETNITYIDTVNKTVNIGTEQIRYNMLIVADGCNGKISSSMLGKYDACAFCIQESLSYSGSPNIKIMFKNGVHGYGWDISSKDTRKVGVGLKLSSKVKPTEFMDSVSNIFGAGVSKRRGAFIPMGLPRSPVLLHDSVTFIGDSMGWVDPITGEGIFYAAISGCIMASSYYRSIGKRVSVTRLFSKKFYGFYLQLVLKYLLSIILYTPVSLAIIRALCAITPGLISLLLRYIALDYAVRPRL